MNRSLLSMLTLFFAVSLYGQSSFIEANPQVTYTEVDVPGAFTTVVTAINTGGDMVGYYNTLDAGPLHAFLLKNGVFTFLDYPGADVTVASGINDSDVVVGYAELGTSQIPYSYGNGTFTPIHVSGLKAFSAVGINNGGDIVGCAEDNSGNTKAYFLRGQRYKLLSPPGNFIYSCANAINTSGEIVGSRGTGGKTKGFDFKSGRYSTIAFPQQLETEAWGINDSGVISGWYLVLPASYNGFILVNGTYTSFDYPGAMNTFAMGLNASAQVVGTYEDSQRNYHGFVSSPMTSIR